MTELYSPLGAPIVMTTPATAELAKYASNALLATLISFSNEFASISEAFPDVDVEEVLGAVHLDRRLSPRVEGAVVRPGILSFLKAGCGYGGSCLPKDLSALIATRRAEGEAHPLLEAVQTVNDSQAAVSSSSWSAGLESSTVARSAFSGSRSRQEPTTCAHHPASARSRSFSHVAPRFSRTTLSFVLMPSSNGESRA